MKPVNTKISGKVNPLSYKHGPRPEQTASSKILTRVCQSCPVYQSPSHESRCSVHRLPEICASHIFKYIIKFDTLPRIQQTSTKMAKLIVTVALLLCVLALAQARASLDLKENDVIKEHVSTAEQESVSKTTATWPASILLPSQKPDSETERSESGKPETETTDFLPLTVINFHPINRHFPHHPSLTFRNRRPCRGHRLGKPWFHHRQITYGNDMLISKGDGKGEVREIPARWPKFPNGDAHVHRFHVWRDDDVTRRDEIRRPSDRHRHHFHRRHEAQWQKDGEEYEHETGFMTKIRKFLGYF